MLPSVVSVFYLVLLGVTGFYLVLLSFAAFLFGCTYFYLFLLCVTIFLVPTSSTKLDWVLRGCTGFFT